MKDIKLKSGNILRIIQDEDPRNPRTEEDNLGTMVCWHSRYNLGDNSETGKNARNKFVPPYDNSEEMFLALSNLDIDLSELDGVEHQEALEKILDAAHTNAVILPLRLYDHSGITMSVGSGAHQFDPGGWDSGQVGWIFMTYAEARKNLKVDENDTVEEWHGPNKGSRVSLEEVIRRVLIGEVETYDQYLTGDVYGFTIVELVKYEKKNIRTGEVTIIEEEDVIDSCWGFFGSDIKENGILEYVDDEILEEVNT